MKLFPYLMRLISMDCDQVRLEMVSLYEKMIIFDFLYRENDKESPYMPLFELLDIKSQKSQRIVSEIISLKLNNQLDIPIDNLLSSLIHMLMNRLFRSKQRLHEMVMYGFLFRFYRSEIAKQKYNN